MSLWDDISNRFNDTVDDMTRDVLDTFYPEPSKEKGNQTASQMEKGDYGQNANAGHSYVQKAGFPVALIVVAVLGFFALKKL